MPAAPPALTIRGRYARLNAGSWVVLGIGLLLLAAAVKFRCASRSTAAEPVDRARCRRL